jgi:hypothetical protein
VRALCGDVLVVEGERPRKDLVFWRRSSRNSLVVTARAVLTTGTIPVIGLELLERERERERAILASSSMLKQRRVHYRF